MIPIGDDNRGRRIFPIVTYSLILINVLVFFYEIFQPDPEAFVYAWGSIPTRIMHGEGLSTLFTSIFMHGGLMHLIGNMLFLWIFGDNVEDAFGHLPYLLFYLVCGVGATFSQIVLNPASTLPQVGASGAIAGVLGAYIVLFGTNRVRVLVGWFFVVSVPAFLMIGLWIIMQLASGIGAFADIQNDIGGVAYGAHIGGFFLGVILTLLMRDWIREGMRPNRLARH